MRLLKLGSNGTFELDLFQDGNLPPYAILSHTWSDVHTEVSFEDIANGSGPEKAGYKKLLFCAQRVKADNLEYFWIDTCCIKKSDLTELSKAITSMFRWYSNAVKCYVYLADVSSDGHQNNETTPNWRQTFRQSRWFTRGWTLQELLAPPVVEFFSHEGHFLDERPLLAREISMITTLPVEALTGSPLQSFSVDVRMQWSIGRVTTEPEDRAYCMLGIFGVSLIPNYGEGVDSAVRRLLQEINLKSQYEIHGAGKIYLSNEVAPLAKMSNIEHMLQLRRKMFQGLKTTSLDARRNNMKEAQAGTCAWFLSHPVFMTWINTDHVKDHHGFLWIRGKPGTGKSTLMKFLYEHFEKQVGGDDILISFFFHARGNTNERTTVDMWRALLYQMLSAAPDLRDTLDEFGSGKLFDSTIGPLTVEQLHRAFQQSVLRLGCRRLKCFVDALDECDEQQIQDMVGAMEITAMHACNAGVEFRICFASRHYPNIIYEHGQQIDLEAEQGHQDDLELYVRSQLRLFRTISIKGVEVLQTRILDGAEGVFIWIVLTISMLKRELSAGRTLAIEGKVARARPQLGEIFSQMLCRDERDRCQTRLAIQFVLFAKRPLSMREYYFAIMSGCSENLDGVLEHDPEQVTERAMRLFVSHSTKGLAEVTRSDPPTIQFIHESVRDFLIRDHGLSIIWPDLKPDLVALSHEKLKQCCYRYLHASSRNFAEKYFRFSIHGRCQGIKDLDALLPFLSYAVQYVLFHAEESAAYVRQTEFLQTFDAPRWIEAVNLYRLSWSDAYTPRASLLYILANENCPALIRAACPDGPVIGREGERHRYPLYAAFAKANMETVLALLQAEKSLDLSQVRWDPHQPPGQYDSTPLLWALRNGYEAIAQALLKSVDRFSILGVSDDDGLDALDHALRRGYARVVEELSSSGLALRRTVGASRESPLCYAARRDNIELVRFLLSNCHLDEVRDATRGAAEWGSLSTFELLLPQYADINTTTQLADDCPSLLHLASAKGHDHIVDFLLEQSAEDACKARVRRTALIDAARRGQDSRVRSLLHRGVEDEAVQPTAETALMAAAQSGHHFTVELLLEYGSSPAAIDLRGLTALHHAAENGRVQVVHTLLKYGARLDARDRQGRTCLLCAAESRPNTPAIKAEKCVTALLEAGADLNAADSEGKSLSYYAVGRMGLEEWETSGSRVLPRKVVNA